MDPSNLRSLYEQQEICLVCRSYFYGGEVLAFFPECPVTHYFHHRCLTAYAFKTNTPKSYKCLRCQQKRSYFSTVVMPLDLPQRLPGGDSPPEGDLPSPPSPPQPEPQSPPRPSPPLLFAPGSSTLDAGEFVSHGIPEILEEPKDEVVAPDGRFPNDPTARYCNTCGNFLESSAWTRFEGKYFCHLCSLESGLGVSFRERPSSSSFQEMDEEEDEDVIADEQEGYADEELAHFDADREGEYRDEEMAADEEGYGTEDMAADEERHGDEELVADENEEREMATDEEGYWDEELEHSDSDEGEYMDEDMADLSAEEEEEEEEDSDSEEEDMADLSAEEEEEDSDSE